MEMPQKETAVTVQELSGADLLAEWLKAQNITAVFSLQGGTIMPSMDAVYRAGLPQYFFSREDGAGFAAIGYAKVTNKPGVLMVSSGPGATNTVTPIADAMRDCIPLVVMTGQVPTIAKDTDAFQETDITSIVSSITKKTYYVEDVGSLESVLNEAFSITVSGKPGPVLIDLPKDVQFNTTELASPFGTYEAHIPVVEFDPDKNFTTVIDVLNSSSKPVIIAGHGLVTAQVSDLFRKFIDRTNIPVVHTLPGKGVMPSGHVSNFGMLGMHGVYTASAAVEYSDLVISLGSRFDDRITGDPAQFAPEARYLVHFDISRKQVEKVLPERKIPVVGDLRDGMRALSESIGEIKIQDRITAWRDSLHRLQKAHPLPKSKYADTEYLDVGYVFNALNSVLNNCTQRTIIVTEIGQHQMWASQYLNIKESGTFLSSTGQGGMGSGFPQAIGVQIASPDSMVICLAGDGSFRLNSPELETLMRYNLPVKIFVINNGGYGIVRQWNETFFEKRLVGVLHHGFDFVAVAHAFGIEGHTVEKKNDLQAEFDKALSHGGSYMLELRLQWEPCLPFIPPGTSFKNIIEK